MKEMKASRIIDTKFILPDINDIDFEEKISQTIRNSIWCWVPYPDALTAREILNIKKQHTLLPLLQNIEKKEYIWEVLDTAEREKTLDILRNKI